MINYLFIETFTKEVYVYFTYLQKVQSLDEFLGRDNEHVRHRPMYLNDEDYDEIPSEPLYVMLICILCIDLVLNFTFEFHVFKCLHFNNIKKKIRLREPSHIGFCNSKFARYKCRTIPYQMSLHVRSRSKIEYVLSGEKT